MTLLVPLGLIALTSIVVLIIIYIIKPNYQQKTVSSTFVWNLSLKYRKKRLPVSKLRNLLIIFCQIMALAAAAFILAQPNKILKARVDYVEKIAIIDSSASMRTETEGETRFERAIAAVLEDFYKLPANGKMHVIIADETPKYFVEEVGQNNPNKIEQALETLFVRDNLGSIKDVLCSYGSSDIEGAISLCENILKRNPDAQIVIYSDIEYGYKPENVTVVNVFEQSEWNASINNAYARIENNYYVFYVDVACYGIDTELTLKMEVQDANTFDSSVSGETFFFEETVICSNDKTKTVIFKYMSQDEGLPDNDESKQYHYIDRESRITSYQSVYVSIDVRDSFDADNKFQIYGGQKEVIKIQYSSTLPNIFFNAMLDTFVKTYKNNWDIQIDKIDPYTAPAEEGYDFYIYEHLSMPAVLPVDGVVLLVNPGTAATGAGFELIDLVDFESVKIPWNEGEKHAVSKNIIMDDITVSRVVSIRPTDPDYKVLARCNGHPVLMVKDKEDAKVVVMPFSLHYSSLPLSKYFPILMLNMFNYFLPPTVEGNAFEVGENMELNSRGQSLTVEYDGKDIQTSVSFPDEFTPDRHGTYVLKQTTFSGKEVSERIYVRIPATENNIWRSMDGLPEPYKEQNPDNYLQDLWIFIASVLVAVLFLEWLLHLREEQ